MDVLILSTPTPVGRQSARKRGDRNERHWITLVSCNLRRSLAFALHSLAGTRAADGFRDELRSSQSNVTRVLTVPPRSCPSRPALGVNVSVTCTVGNRNLWYSRSSVELR